MLIRIGGDKQFAKKLFLERAYLLQLVENCHLIGRSPGLKPLQMIVDEIIERGNFSCKVAMIRHTRHLLLELAEFYEIGQRGGTE